MSRIEKRLLGDWPRAVLYRSKVWKQAVGVCLCVCVCFCLSLSLSMSVWVTDDVTVDASHACLVGRCVAEFQ